jgi:hypothetical protein
MEIIEVISELWQLSRYFLGAFVVDIILTDIDKEVKVFNALNRV